MVDLTGMPNTLSLLQAGMPTLHAGDAVDLLDGGEVVAKGHVISTDPASTLHGQPMPLGHVSVSVVRVLKGTTYIPYPPPHEPEACRLADVMGYVIASPSVALAVSMSLACILSSRVI